MNAIGRVFVGLPAYNEEIALPRLLERVELLGASLHNSIVVVIYDDGSTDSTNAIARQWQQSHPLVLLEGPVNKGLGAGVQAIIQYVVKMGSDEDLLVVMDCDDTHDPTQIDSMIMTIKGGADVVIASRYMRGAVVTGVPGYRHVTAIGAFVLFKLIHPIRGVRDYTSGFRAYRISALRHAAKRYGAKLIEEFAFPCMTELLLKLNALGFRLVEVPLQLRYDRKPTSSKMGVGRNMWRLLTLLVRWRLYGLHPS